MYFRQTLKRTREDHNSLAKLPPSKASRPPVGSVSTSKKASEKQEGSYDHIILTPPQAVFSKEGAAKGCSPLLRHSYAYPPKIAQLMLNDQVRFRQAGHASGISWLFCDRTLYLWRNREYTQQEVIPMDESWQLQFSDAIVCVQMGYIPGMLHVGKSVVLMLAVAFLGELRLLSFDGKRFEETGLSFLLDEHVHQIVFTPEGNIIRAGGNGYAQMLVCNASSNSFKERNSLSLWKRVKTMLRPVVNYTVQQMLLDPSKKLLYCLVTEVTDSGWLARKLYKFSNRKQTKIVVYEVTHDSLSVAYQLEEARVKDKLKANAPLVAADWQRSLLSREAQIVSLFLPKFGMLGIVLRNGMFAVLRNVAALEVESITGYSTSPLPSLLFEKQGPTANPPEEILQSLGVSSLSVTGSSLAYFSSNNIDAIEMKFPYGGQLVDITKEQKWLYDAPFEQHRQWLYFHSAGVEHITRYTPTDKLLILLNIRDTRFSKLLDQKILQLLEDLCETIGVVEFCSNLIEIICNPRLKVKVDKALYERTIKKLEEDQIGRDKVTDESLGKPNKVYLVIESDLRMRNSALHLLRLFDYMPVRTRSLEPQNIYSECLGLVSTPTSDSLWYSVLLYFSSMYDCIRNQTIDFFKGKNQRLDEFMGRLDSFSNFLLEKEKELMTCREFSKAKDVPLEEVKYNLFMDIEEESTQPLMTSKHPKQQSLPGVSEYPSNNTSILISKLVLTVERTYMLIQVLRRLNFVNSADSEKQEQTVHEMLTNPQAQRRLRGLIFRSMKLEDPLIARINQLMPELISKEDVVFERWAQHPEKLALNLQQAVKVLDVDRLQQIRKELFKTSNFSSYYDILLKRLKYLLEQRKVTEQAISHSLSGSKNRYLLETAPTERQKQLQQLDQRKKQLVASYEQQLELFLKDLADTVERARKERTPADIKRLDDMLTVVYASDQQGILERCLSILQDKMMTSQIRYLRTHSLLSQSEATNKNGKGWK